jgi:hypothetical protein
MDEMEGKMTEEKKKPGIIKQIFKWIGLGLLAALIFGALIYDAPWKAIALLLVILAGCTILPRPAKKWFWLSAAAVVVILIIWVFLPENNEGWRPYTFDKELAALNAKYAVPDSENAAMIYNELFQNHNEVTFWDNLPVDEQQKLPMREPWLSKDHPQIAEWLKDQQKTIDTLIEISRIEKCRFPITAGFIEPEYMKYSPKMRGCAFLLVSAANNDIAEGRIDTALEKWLCLIQMGKHLRQQPTLSDTLVGIAIEALATNQFNKFIVTSDATEERLSFIEHALADIKYDWSYDWPRILESEKLLTKNLFGMFYEINPKGKVRLIRDPMAAIEVQFPQFLQEIPPLTYWQKKLLKASTILGWFFMPSTPQKAGRIIGECYEKYYAMADPNLIWQKEALPLFSNPTFFHQLRLNYRYFANFMAEEAIESLYGVRDLYPRWLAENRGSQIIIALRRYKNKTGHWPENLDEVKSLAPAEIIVDPLNNNSFIYKLTDDSFTLYSKGKNNIDEAGEYETEWAADYSGYKVKEDDRLIWPPKSRKTKKENTDDRQQ